MLYKNISLGTMSDDKRKILQSFLKGEVSITQISANSEISDQPLTIRETISGSQNRAKNAFSDDFDISIGMEGGLVKIDGVYNLVCATSIFNGKNYFTGVSFFTPLPNIVSVKIDQGEEFGVAIREFQVHNSDVDVQELVSREKSFIDSISKAFDYFLS